MTGSGWRSCLTDPQGSNLSATLMKYFDNHGLLPTDKHKIYPFRHSFKDRLKAVEAPEELIDEMLGPACVLRTAGKGDRTTCVLI